MFKNAQQYCIIQHIQFFFLSRFIVSRCSQTSFYPDSRIILRFLVENEILFIYCICMQVWRALLSHCILAHVSDEHYMCLRAPRCAFDVAEDAKEDWSKQDNNNTNNNKTHYKPIVRFDGLVLSSWIAGKDRDDNKIFCSLRAENNLSVRMFLLDYMLLGISCGYGRGCRGRQRCHHRIIVISVIDVCTLQNTHHTHIGKRQACVSSVLRCGNQRYASM